MIAASAIIGIADDGRARLAGIPIMPGSLKNGAMATIHLSPDEKGARGQPRAPDPVTSLSGEDYIEAAELADEAAPAAAVAADAAESAAVEAPEAAEAAIEAELSADDEAIESGVADESAEDESAAWLQAERVRAAPATAAARTILRMYGIP